jgi:hypothetical protein
MRLKQCTDEVLAKQDSVASAAIANTTRLASDLETLTRTSCEDLGKRIQESETRHATLCQEHLEQHSTITNKRMGAMLEKHSARSVAACQSKLEESITQIQAAVRNELAGHRLNQSLVDAIQEDADQRTDALREVVSVATDKCCERVVEALRVAEDQATEERGALADDVVSRVAAMQQATASLIDDLSAQTRQQTHVLADESAQNEARARALFAKHDESAVRCR